MAESKSKSKPKTKSKPQQKQKQKQSQIVNVNINSEKPKSKPKKKSKSKPEQSLKGPNYRMSSQQGYRYIVQNQPSIIQQMSIPNNNELMSTIQEILNRNNPQSSMVPVVNLKGTKETVKKTLKQYDADMSKQEYPRPKTPSSPDETGLIARGSPAYKKLTPIQRKEIDWARELLKKPTDSRELDSENSFDAWRA